MLKNSILAPALAVFLLASTGTSADAAKTKKQNQPPAALNNLQAPQSGRYDTTNSNSSSGSYNSSSSSSSINSGSGSGSQNGDGQSLSMFKAGNTSLPAGTYAMTNVSTGAAFVVIVDDSGDMRAQDARAMNLVGDKTAKHSRSKRSNDSSYNNQPYNNSERDYNSANSGNSSNYGSGNQNNYDNGGSNFSGSSSGIPTSLPPQPTPASAILPAPTGGHPLLQGANQMTAPSQSSLGSVLPGLFSGSGQNGLQQGLPGQLPGGVKGALQQELQRQIMKHAPDIERQVRKYIK